MCSFIATTDLQNLPCLCVVQQMAGWDWVGAPWQGMWDILEDWEGNQPRGTQTEPTTALHFELLQCCKNLDY